MDIKQNSFSCPPFKTSIFFCSKSCETNLKIKKRKWHGETPHLNNAFSYSSNFNNNKLTLAKFYSRLRHYELFDTEKGNLPRNVVMVVEINIFSIHLGGAAWWCTAMQPLDKCVDVLLSNAPLPLKAGKFRTCTIFLFSGIFFCLAKKKGKKKSPKNCIFFALRKHESKTQKFKFDTLFPRFTPSLLFFFFLILSFSSLIQRNSSRDGFLF